MRDEAGKTSWVLLKIDPKEYIPKKTLIQKDMYTPVYIAALFLIAKIGKQPKCPSTDEWIKKIWYLYTMEYHSAIKKRTKF